MASFYETYYKKIHIGDIQLQSNVLMAPLAGYTCFPFRVMVEELGAGTAYTEMVSVDGLKYNDLATKQFLFTNELEKLKCVQLLGTEPALFERACKSDALACFDIVDINMGCPVPNIMKSKEGCSLVEDIPKAKRIIEACKRSGKIVSVKCRPGIQKNKIVIKEFSKMCEQAGADMLTVHGRTRDMMYEGEPMYETIACAKESVRIPVFANGGIFSEEDAMEMMKNTGADGVMLARYGFENPLLFAKLTGKESMDSKYNLLLKQIELVSKYYNELFALDYIKKLTSYFIKKIPGTKRYKLDLYRCGNMQEMKEILEKIFHEGK